MSRKISFYGVFAVWSRHFQLYRKTWKVNCLPPLSEPIVYLTAFGLGMSPLIGDVSYQDVSVPYLEFIAPGMIAIGVLFQSFFEGAYGTFVRQKYQLTWQAMLTTPLTAIEVFTGDLLWAASKGIFAGLATALIAIVWGIFPILGLFSVLPFIVLGSLVFAAAGLFAAFTVKTVEQLNIPIFLFVVPMFALCGTYFPRDVLPTWLGYFAEVLPLSLLCDLLRVPIAYPTYPLLTLFVLSVWCLGLVFLSWKVTRKKLFG